MRVRGTPLSVNVTETVRLADGVEVTISPVGLTFRAELVRRLPDPRASVRIIRGADGKPQYHQEGSARGQAIVGPDTQDPAYQVKRREQEALQLVAVFHEGTREHGDIEWSSAPPAEDAEPSAWLAFYTSAMEELHGAGIRMGQLARVVGAITKLSGMDAEEVDELAAGFSSEGPESVAPPA